MKSADVRRKFIEFFKARGHMEVPSAPLVPENDPTTLFTGSGMQPMLPYLLGQPYPHGLTRIVDSQKCFRGQDIEEVGDNRHDTFFEMLGNWSLGDYFKEEQQAWIWEFLTKELKLNPKKLYISVFEGNDVIPRDEESDQNWKNLGVPQNHIYYYGVNKNWWARSSYDDMPVGEPGGPSSEIFYDFGIPHNKKYGEECHPNCDCGRFLEIGNNVFMTYQKTQQGFIPLVKKNIDFGGGLERLTSACHDDPDMFKTDMYINIIASVERLSGKPYEKSTQSQMRVIADHLKASVFLIKDGVLPGNKTQGYFLRRLLRRAIVKMQQLGGRIADEIIDTVVKTYDETDYFTMVDTRHIKQVIADEGEKFNKTLREGMKNFENTSPFDLYQTYGFPIEVTRELYKEKGLHFDTDQFEKEKEKHQILSRIASKGMFKGGLQDHSIIITKYHTATHLLHAALRQVLGVHIQQKGSNITAERLRFDFSYGKKLTDLEISKIEELVNEKIRENILVERLEMEKSKALELGALAFFPEKYPGVTSVYKIGEYSLELCGGPHVDRTGVIGMFRITKEESAAAGVRRIYAVVG